MICTDNVEQFCVSQCAADDCASSNAWCKVRYTESLKAFPASTVSARNMIHVFCMSKRPSVNAVCRRRGIRTYAQAHCGSSPEMLLGQRSRSNAH